MTRAKIRNYTLGERERCQKDSSQALKRARKMQLFVYIFCQQPSSMIGVGHEDVAKCHELQIFEQIYCTRGNTFFCNMGVGGREISSSVQIV